MTILHRSKCSMLALAGVMLCSCASAAPEDHAFPAASAALPAQCVAEDRDTDGDGLTDACERHLAVRHAPMLMFSARRCTVPSVRHRAEVPGGYFHAVQPVRGAIRVLYLPAYYRDCGWSGAKCVLADCAPHAGDSELIALDLHPERDGDWIVARIFLSAHCFDSLRSSCRWYSGADLQQFSWIDSVTAPVIWVSSGRHANYPSRGACERGHRWIETCDADARPVRFPVIAARNIGSRAAPLQQQGQPPGCVSGAFVEPDELLLVGPDAVECFWSAEQRFRGWQGSGDGATAYGRYLQVLEL